MQFHAENSPLKAKKKKEEEEEEAIPINIGI